MNHKIIITEIDFPKTNFEFIERKGSGHPDTLADELAEFLSNNYSQFTLKNFGAILHHNFDKVGLLGGSSFVTFGKGGMIKPIRVLLNGRASLKFGKKMIPVEKLLIKWTKQYFKVKFPLLNVNKNLEFHNNLSNQSSPGKTNENAAKKGTRQFWFEPRSLNDLQELKKLISNDTSLGVGYAPGSDLEKLVLEIEYNLNSQAYKLKNPWIGSDIKILGFRMKDDYEITMCIPQIANYVHSIRDYKDNLSKAKKDILEIANKNGVMSLIINVNTRDNYDLCEIYLTAIGSSIESGDEGLVGRGNRINAVISPNHPMSMEGACGKNPVYHIGKLYYVVAMKIASEINKKFGVYNEVFLASQSGRDLLDPWITLIALPKGIDKKQIEKIVTHEIKNIPKITLNIVNNQIKL